MLTFCIISSLAFWATLIAGVCGLVTWARHT